MFKSKTVLETKRDERVFTLEFDNPSSLVELIDVLSEFRRGCVSQLEESISQEEAKSQEMLSKVSQEETKSDSEDKED